jgi:hypothetical protein
MDPAGAGSRPVDRPDGFDVEGSGLWGVVHDRERGPCGVDVVVSDERVEFSERVMDELGCAAFARVFSDGEDRLTAETGARVSAARGGRTGRARTAVPRES